LRLLPTAQQGTVRGSCLTRLFALMAGYGGCGGFDGGMGGSPVSGYGGAAGGYVNKVDYDKLAARVAQCERRLLGQNNDISYLKEAVEAVTAMNSMSPMFGNGSSSGGKGSRKGGGGMQMMQSMQEMMMASMMGMGADMGGSSGGRDRTPRGIRNVKPQLPVPADPSSLKTLEEFCSENRLDDKCVQNLVSQPIEVQQFVIAQGPPTGGNTSAMITARISKTAEYSFQTDPEELSQKLESFIQNSTLDEKVSEELRSQSQECHAAVIAFGPPNGRNPSAIVAARMAKFKRGLL